jgi:hypothetical protein
MISVKSDIQDVVSSLTAIERKKVPRSTRAALNRLGITIRKVHRANLVEEVNPRRKGDVSKAVTLEKATAANRKRGTRGRDFIEIITNEDYLHLGQVRDTKVSSFRKGKRRAQRVRFRGRVVRGAFRPTNLRNQEGRQGRSIFKQAPGKYRTGSRKIRKLYAFSILQELVKKRLHKKLNKISASRFEIEFQRALANELRKG